MADVKVNIPGIGEVVATNAASEETLNKLLAVMSKTAKAQDPTQGIFKKMNKEFEDQKKVAEEFEKSLEGLTKEQKKALEAERASTIAAARWATALNGGTQAVSAIGITLGSLGKSVLSLGTQMATSYDEIAKNPIGAAAGQVNTAIDMANTAIHGVADASAGVAHAFGGIPVIGPVVSGLGDAASAAAKGLADLAAAVLHVANDVMAKEFQKSADALDSYTKQGASFAGGMMEMRTLANDAGISLAVLKDAAKSSSESIRAAGLSQGEGTAALANGFLASTKTIGKSGASLSNELIALGYNYQEQIEVQASYMSQLKKTGVDLKNLTPEDLARGTREYAQNLKVISDITGQDAKKLMDKAATETQRASIMNELDTKQKTAYQNAFAALEKMGPDADKARQALFQIMKTGTTNVIGYTQGPALEMIKNLANGVKSGNMEFKDAIGVMSDSAKEAAEANKGSVGATTDMVKGFGISSEAVDGFTQTQNSLLTLNSQSLKEMVNSSDKNATAQADLAGKAGSVEQSFAGVTRSAQNAAVAMEGLASSHLGEYAKLLDDTLSKTTAAFQKAIDFINSGFDLETLKPKEDLEKQKKLDAQDEANAKAASFAEKLFSSHYIAVGLEELAKGAGKGLEAVGATTVGSWTKELGQMAQEERVKSETEYIKDKDIPKYANGGIASGPTTGFLSMLHGNELVLPLQADGTIKPGTEGYKAVMDMLSGPNAMPNMTPSTGDSASRSMLEGFTGSVDNVAKSVTGLVSAQEARLGQTSADISKLLSNQDAQLKQSTSITADLLSQTSGILADQTAKLSQLVSTMPEDIKKSFLESQATQGTNSVQFKDLSDAIANSNKNLTAQMADVGTKFTPTDFSSAFSDFLNPIDSLTELVKKLTDSVSKNSSNSVTTTASTQDTQTQSNDMASRQLETMQEMVAHLRDHKDITQKLLHASL